MTDQSYKINSNAYFRSTPLDYPLISLSGYLRFWAVAFVLVTGYLTFFQTEVSLVVTLDAVAFSLIYCFADYRTR